MLDECNEGREICNEELVRGSVAEETNVEIQEHAVQEGECSLRGKGDERIVDFDSGRAHSRESCDQGEGNQKKSGQGRNSRDSGSRGRRGRRSRDSGRQSYRRRSSHVASVSNEFAWFNFDNDNDSNQEFLGEVGLSAIAKQKDKPLDYLLLMLGTEFIAAETNQYAHQKRVADFEISLVEVAAFLGLNIAMSIVNFTQDS